MRELLSWLESWRSRHRPPTEGRPADVADHAAPDPDSVLTSTEQSLRPRVLLVIFDPPVPSQGGRPLTRVCGFNDPRALADGYVSDLAEVSDGYLQYEVVETVQANALPQKTDGYCYSADEFVRCWRRGGGWHEPDAVDYPALLAAFDVVRRMVEGDLDELWLFGPPYAGFWESARLLHNRFDADSGTPSPRRAGRLFRA